jgi:peptidoglycan/xylan/chitin deacetylase (PgdA/CDA1 family)
MERPHHSSPRKKLTLAYHDLFESAPKDCFSVSVPDFDSQVCHLRSLDPGTMGPQIDADPYRDIRFRTGGALVTFDDGHSSDLDAAHLLSEKWGVRGVFFITSGNIGVGPRWIDAAGIRELVRMGCPIQGHGHTHRFLTLLDDRELKEELATSRKTLEDLTGREVNALSFPGGRYDDRVVRMAYDAGYRHFYTSRPTAVAEPLPSMDGAWAYHRILIRTDTGLARFQRIVAGGRGGAAMMDLAYRCKIMLQAALGDGMYQRLWEWRQGRRPD